MSGFHVARDGRDTALTGGNAMQRPWAIGAAVLAIAVLVIVVMLVVMHMNGASASGGSSGGYGY
jgi:hypothetical protein